jgi:hypothetical protein
VLDGQTSARQEFVAGRLTTEYTFRELVFVTRRHADNSRLLPAPPPPSGWRIAVRDVIPSKEKNVYIPVAPFFGREGKRWATRRDLLLTHPGGTAESKGRTAVILTSILVRTSLATYVATCPSNFGA